MIDEVQFSRPDLPEGWEQIPLLEACRLVRGVSYRRGEELTKPREGFLPLLRANNIDGDLKFQELRYVPVENVSADQYLRTGDVVLAMSSGSKSVVGKAATVRKKWTGTFGAFCGVLRPVDEIYWPYFGLFFQTKEYRDKISDSAVGVNINNLRREYFEAIKLPLPPLAEQKRVVYKVESLLTGVNAARVRLAKVKQILKRFRQAVLAAACSGRLTEDWRKKHPNIESDSDMVIRNQKGRTGVRIRKEHDSLKGIEELFEIPSSWAWVRFGNVCNDVTVGHVGPMADQYRETGIPFLRSQNVREFHFDPAGLKYIGREFHNTLHKSALSPGDVVVVRSGFAGVACVIPESLKHANCADLVVIRPSEALNPYYACIFVNSNAGRAHVDEVKVGIAQSHFNIGAARKTPLPLPPIEEQREIVSRVEALFKLADSIEKRVETATKRADKLTQAILAKAFRGELIPTEAGLAHREGRGYEPASVLLERIQAARKASATKLSSGRKRHVRKKTLE